MHMHMGMPSQRSADTTCTLKPNTSATKEPRLMWNRCTHVASSEPRAAKDHESARWRQHARCAQGTQGTGKRLATYDLRSHKMLVKNIDLPEEEQEQEQRRKGAR